MAEEYESDKIESKLVKAHTMFDSNDDAEPENEPENELDNDDNLALHRKILGFYREELDRQYENRIQQNIDAEYYDHKQWSDEDEAVLKERGQAALVYNVISQSANWVIGSEKRGRVDFNILPRTSEDAKPAEIKTKLLKYLSDVNKTQFHRSRAFEDCVKVGIGWLEDGAAEPDDGGEIIYSRYESWRNMLWDSAGTEYDLSDSRYLSRSKWIDADVLEAYFPDRKELIKLSSSNGHYGSEGDEYYSDDAMDSQEAHLDNDGLGMDSNIGGDRRRVHVIEMWYRKPEQVMKIIASNDPIYVGQVFDKENKIHVQMVQGGSAVIEMRTAMTVHVVIMTTKGLLFSGKSPYKHNRFPFTPIWGYRRDRDQMPYGLIRGLRDIQDDINKRGSKALHILNSNRIIMEDGAVEDVEELREEASDPQGIIVLKGNKKRFEFDVDRSLEASHLNIMDRNIGMVQQVSGVTDELMGRQTNAQSGVAVQNRQNQGLMSTAKLFDNHRFATQLQGEIQLSLIEQYISQQKTFRITNERGAATFIQANDGLPENDITRSKADFVVGQEEWRATIRQAQAEQLMSQLGQMGPQVAMVILDLVIDSTDLPNKDEIVKRIRAINGQRNPESTELTPEEQAAEAAKQKQAQMQEAAMMAELENKQADTRKKMADASKSEASAVETKVDTEKTALDAATMAVQTPGAIPLADKLLKSSGFLSMEEMQAIQQQQIRNRQRAEQMQQQAQAQQQAPQPQPQPEPEPMIQ